MPKLKRAEFGVSAFYEASSDVFESGVVAEFQLRNEPRPDRTYGDLFGILKTFGITGCVEETVLGEGAQVLHFPLSLLFSFSATYCILI